MIRKYHNHNHNPRQTHGTARKSPTTIMRHQDDKSSKATSSLPHQDDCKAKMDIKLRLTKHTIIKTPTKGVTINNESTTTEPPP